MIDSYNAEFSRIEPASSWNGDRSSCNGGTTANDYQTSVLSRVNWYRRTVGLNAVTYDSAAQQKVQAAALYQSVAGKLSHYIEPGTTCYSDAAADGSMTSNLALGVHGTRAIDMYIVDPGPNNAAVGHRRWIMSPTLKAVATGDIEASGSFYAANALSVVGDTVPSVVPVGTPITWPSAGYFPDALVPARWSFTTAQESGTFTNATVTVTGPAGPVATTVEFTSNGTIVFLPGVTSRVSADTTYRVDISGVTGASRSGYNYEVTLVDVNEAPRFGGSSGYRVPNCSPIGTDVIRPIVLDDSAATNLSLIAGLGDTDNRYFKINGLYVSIATELPAAQSSYSGRVRATDTQGAAVETTLAFTLPAADTEDVTCPVRNVTVTDVAGAVKVSWDAPKGPTGGTFHIATDPDGGYCKTTALSCTLNNLTKAKTYTLKVYYSRGSWWSDSVTVTHTVGGTSTVKSTLPELKRKRTYTLAKIMTIPAGTKRYSVSGPCKLNRGRTKLTTTSRAGRCTVKIVAKTSRNGKTKTTTRTTKFSVT